MSQSVSLRADEVHVKQRIAKGCQPFLGLELLCGEGALVLAPRQSSSASRQSKAQIPRRVIDLLRVGNLACAVALRFSA